MLVYVDLLEENDEGHLEQEKNELVDDQVEVGNSTIVVQIHKSNSIE
jgi:hypothetical protein